MQAPAGIFWNWHYIYIYIERQTPNKWVLAHGSGAIFYYTFGVFIWRLDPPSPSLASLAGALSWQTRSSLEARGMSVIFQARCYI